MRASSVLGDVAADGAGSPAGWVGRVEVTAGLNRDGQVKVDHARLHHGALVGEIDLKYAVHAGEADHDAAKSRDGAAAQARAGAASDERQAMARSKTGDRAHLPGGLRQDDSVRTGFVHAAIVFVQA